MKHSMDTSRLLRLGGVALSALTTVAALSACNVQGTPPYVEPSRVNGHLLAVQLEPPAPINIRPAPGGEIVLSEHGCFALRRLPNKPVLVIYAPYGAAITPDGQGFTYKNITLRLGDQMTGFSGSFSGFRHVENPSPSLRECRPRKVVELW